MATVATHNMPSATRPSYARKLTTTSGDYDMSYTPDVRRSLGTYGLTPPAVESYDVQTDRCELDHYTLLTAIADFPSGLRLLAMKPTPLEKFQYLVHLRATNVHLFYRLLGENIKVSKCHPQFVQSHN